MKATYYDTTLYEVEVEFIPPCFTETVVVLEAFVTIERTEYEGNEWTPGASSTELHELKTKQGENIPLEWLTDPSEVLEQAQTVILWQYQQLVAA